MSTEPTATERKPEKPSVLVVDDEYGPRESIAYTLGGEFTVGTADRGRLALEMVREREYDAVVLDIRMPEMDGMEACREIREIPECANTIIAFLTARNEDYSQIAGLEAGGDDYVSKPIKPKVLMSRIHALLRRQNAISTKNDANDDFIIDRERYLIIINKIEIQLPKKEFELLAFLASRPNVVFKRDVILDTVWGSEVVVGDRTIDVHIRKLREKIGDEYITTIKGVGYKFNL